MKWVETSAEVYAVIWARHKSELTVFGAFTNMEPSYLSNTPQILTEWGFSGGDLPIMKHVTEWVHGKREETATHRYWLNGGVCE